VRALTWNTGCAYGSTYKRSNVRAWQQVAAWAPDVAFLQEVMRPPWWVPASEVVFTPYDFSDELGTAIWMPGGAPRPADLALKWLPRLPPQVTVTEAEVDGVARLIASIHANTNELVREELPGLPESVSCSTSGKVFPLDVILADLAPHTAGRRFIVGGDLNAALRFQALYAPTSVYYGNGEWFGKAAAAGWRAVHPKFHAGEQRTLFRPGKDEAFQLDHLLCDRKTSGRRHGMRGAAGAVSGRAQ
jgi:hypothetical protein